MGGGVRGTDHQGLIGGMTAPRVHIWSIIAPPFSRRSFPVWTFSAAVSLIVEDIGDWAFYPKSNEDEGRAVTCLDLRF